MVSNGFLIIFLQSEGLLMGYEKIGAVIAVILLIFALVVGYLLLTNRKVNQLEQKLQELEGKE
ncbi:MAG: hypothetical protein AAFR61_23980 [Bacteroidota bacterium]